MKNLLVILFMLVISGCSSNEPISESPQNIRHQESGENTYFRFGNMAFDRYIAITKRKILRTRVDITDQNREKILAANSPFEWAPDSARCQKNKLGKYKNGVLLIHGLSDSPFLMQDIGKHFLEKCFLVRGLVLPGHGTVPGDLLRVRFEEWIKAAEYGINSFKGLVDNLSLVGFSTGGALSAYHALNRDDIKSIMLFSPAFQIKSEQIFLSGTVKVLSGIVESLTWVDFAKDEDYAKYESFPINAAYQIYQLTKKVDSVWQKQPLKIPLFIAASQEDMTIETNRTIDFFQAQNNSKNKMILYTNERKKFKSDQILTKPGKYQNERISELSHLSIMTSPNNGHYGKNGDYRSCLHYLKDPEKMGVCKIKKDIPAGELLEKNLSGPVFMRLTYNPDFNGLLKEIDRFLESIR